MAVSISTFLATAIWNSTANGGHTMADAMANGVIEVYGVTSRPVNADAAIPSGSVLLGYVTNGGGAFTAGSPTNGINFGAVSNGVMGKATSENWQFTAIAAGQATWMRHKGNPADAGVASTVFARIDSTIATFGGDVTMLNTTIAVGDVHTFNGVAFNIVVGI